MIKIKTPRFWTCQQYRDTAKTENSLLPEKAAITPAETTQTMMEQAPAFEALCKHSIQIVMTSAPPIDSDSPSRY